MQRKALLDRWKTHPNLGSDSIARIVVYAYNGHAGVVDVFGHYFLKSFTLGRFSGMTDISMSKIWEKRIAAIAVVCILPSAYVMTRVFDVHGNKGFGIVTLAIIIVIYVLLGLISYPIGRRIARTRLGECRNCGYSLDLSFSSQKIVVDSDEYNVGPDICSECGQKWPLITPH